MEFKTRALTIIVRPNGIVELLNNEGWNDADTIEVAQENIAMLKKAVNGQARGMLSHMPSTYMSKEVLECYENAEIGEVASALLTTSFGSKIVGNLFLKLTGKSSSRLGQGKTPIKIFTKKEDAEKWLLEQLYKHAQ
ncbi:MAG: Unknown protein [uncultured Aureispira sp.]|uniref:Uncharacterized protein n=1 Tax=uncultured Aureispira sp. TaxID=1331704 RepID=A0A6S6TP44_9BACT|nr:MAG: Unknown protein [uncultured Aureispira sp.]